MRPSHLHDRRSRWNLPSSGAEMQRLRCSRGDRLAPCRADHDLRRCLPERGPPPARARLGLFEPREPSGCDRSGRVRPTRPTASAAVGVIAFVRLVVAAAVSSWLAVLADRRPRREVLIVTDLVRGAMLGAMALLVAADGARPSCTCSPCSRQSWSRSSDPRRSRTRRRREDARGAHGRERACQWRRKHRPVLLALRWRRSSSSSRARASSLQPRLDWPFCRSPGCADRGPRCPAPEHAAASHTSRRLAHDRDGTAPASRHRALLDPGPRRRHVQRPRGRDRDRAARPRHGRGRVARRDGRHRSHTRRARGGRPRRSTTADGVLRGRAPPVGRSSRGAGRLAGPAPALVLLLLVGIGNTMVDVAGITLLQRSAPDAVLGRVFGAFEALVLLAMGIGSLVAPLLVAGFGVRAAVAAAGCILPVALFPLWRPLLAVGAGAVCRHRARRAASRSPDVRAARTPAAGAARASAGRGSHRSRCRGLPGG